MLDFFQSNLVLLETKKKRAFNSKFLLRTASETVFSLSVCIESGFEKKWTLATLILTPESLSGKNFGAFFLRLYARPVPWSEAFGRVMTQG